MPKVKVNGINLYYEEHGSGTPLLMTHGFAGTTRMWDPQVEALSQKYRFITYDMRGHGQTDSPEAPAQYTVGAVVEDLYQLLRHLGIAKGIIGGLSLGGFITLKFYEAHPEVCRALILCNTGPGYRTPERAEGWNKRCIEQADRLEREGMEVLITSGGSESYTPPELMRKHNSRGLAMVSRNVMVNPAAIHVLERVNVPTLIIVGDGDQAFLPACEYMQKRIKNSELVVIKNAGHGSNVDQPQQFNQSILGFVERAGIQEQGSVFSPAQGCGDSDKGRRRCRGGVFSEQLGSVEIVLLTLRQAGGERHCPNRSC